MPRLAWPARHLAVRSRRGVPRLRSSEHGTADILRSRPESEPIRDPKGRLREGRLSLDQSRAELQHPAASPAMSIAYLVNQYPAVSHSFIRREILALEARASRRAFSVGPPARLSSIPATRRGRRRPTSSPPRWPLLRLLGTLLANPARGFKPCSCPAHRPGSDRGLLRHFIYLAEAACCSRCRLGRIEHLHAHFGTNSAGVALLVHMICGTT